MAVFRIFFVAYYKSMDLKCPLVSYLLLYFALVVEIPCFLALLSFLKFIISSS